MAPQDPPPHSPSDPGFDEFVRAIVEAVLDYLGLPSSSTASTTAFHAAEGLLRAPDVPGAVCSECDGACAVRCEPRIRSVLAAGAARVSAPPTPGIVAADLASLIDHTLLKPDATGAEIENLCREAVEFGFASVCVNPWYVPLAVACTRGSGVRVCTVIGFPLGATLTRVKVFEAEEVLKLGATEIDMVQNVGALKSGDDDQVEADIRAVASAAHRAGAICKVILETSLLTADEKVRAALAAQRAGADFLKTSTGFSSSGATVEDVALLRAAVGGRMGLKASGGIRTLGDVQKMVAAGATRIGASASVKIVEQAR